MTIKLSASRDNSWRTARASSTRCNTQFKGCLGGNAVDQLRRRLSDQSSGGWDSKLAIEGDHQRGSCAADVSGSRLPGICRFMEAQAFEPTSGRKTANAIRVEINTLDAADKNDRTGTRAYLTRSVYNGAQTRQSDLARDFAGRIDVATRTIEMDGRDAPGARDQVTEPILISSDNMSSEPDGLAGN